MFVQDFARLVWGLASAGRLSEHTLSCVNLQSSDSDGLSPKTEQQLAATYLSWPNLANHVPQSTLLRCLQARKAKLSNAPDPQASCCLPLHQGKTLK